jgi:hypothetical protein
MSSSSGWWGWSSKGEWWSGDQDDTWWSSNKGQWWTDRNLDWSSRSARWTCDLRDATDWRHEILSDPVSCVEDFAAAHQVCATIPFIPTNPENSQCRAARFIINLCEAIVDLQKDTMTGWNAANVQHYQRHTSMEWDTRKNVDCILPSTSALSMIGNLKLGISQDDWPPASRCIEQQNFQFVWTHFPCAKGCDYSSHIPRQLYTPRDQTLSRYQKHMEVQIGFTMDVMIAVRDEVAKLRPAKQGYVATIFSQVGAGAFVDKLVPEEQSLCMVRIMRALIGALTTRKRKQCILYVSGGHMDANGNWSWVNKMGNAASIEVPTSVRDCFVAGSFDCLALARGLGRHKAFSHVGVAMAGDKNKIGNAWLSHHWNKMTCRTEFCAWNASDENNTRRSSVLPWVLKVNAPKLAWKTIDTVAVHKTKLAAETFLCQTSSSNYTMMMDMFHGVFKLLQVARKDRKRVPELGLLTEIISEKS